MTKKRGNGNGRTEPSADSITVLRQRVAGLRARRDELQAGLNTAVTERDTLTQARPEVASRALVGGDENAKGELKDLNARLLTLADLIVGYEHDVLHVRAELSATEAEIAEAERSVKIAERTTRLHERAEAVAATIAAIKLAGDHWSRAGMAEDAANQISRSLGEPDLDPRGQARQIRGAIVLAFPDRGRHGITLTLVGDTTPNEARRVLAA